MTTTISNLDTGSQLRVVYRPIEADESRSVAGTVVSTTTIGAPAVLVEVTAQERYVVASPRRKFVRETASPSPFPEVLDEGETLGVFERFERR